MKTLQITLGILFLAMLFTTTTSAQISQAVEKTSFNIHRTIELTKATRSQDIKIEVNEKECRFNLRINSKVMDGKVKVEIYDPKGKKQGNFSVGCQMDSDNSKEMVNGMITKAIEKPELGDWKVKIIPTKAVGKVTIQFSQDITVCGSSN